ncbi:hypothetical protein [Spirulina major]|nr:hypothetical protein [Spirulina major]
MMRVCSYLGVVIAVVGLSDGAIAQIQPDNTLATEGSILNGNVIEGGAF